MTALKATLVFIGLALSGVAAAEDVSTTKTSSLPPVLANTYGSLYLRHSTGERMTPTGETNLVPGIVVIPTLGTRLFDEKLDMAVSWYFTKKASSVRVNRAVTYAEITYSIIDTEKTSLFPYIYTEQADGASFSILDVGPHLDIKRSVGTPAGKLALTAFVEPLAEFTSGHHAPKAPVNDRTDHATQAQLLTDDGSQPAAQPAPAAEKEIEARDPSFSSTTELNAKLALDAVKGLAVSAGVDYLQNWNPHYDAKTEDGDVRYELSGYETKSAVMNKVGVSYKLTDKVTVANQVRYMVNGLYTDTFTTQAVSGIANRIENRLSLTATLF